MLRKPTVDIRELLGSLEDLQFGGPPRKVPTCRFGLYVKMHKINIYKLSRETGISHQDLHHIVWNHDNITAVWGRLVAENLGVPPWYLFDNRVLLLDQYCLEWEEREGQSTVSNDDL